MSDKNKIRAITLLIYNNLGAERARFELANQFCRSHAFQACLFSHSSISPFFFRKAGAKVSIIHKKTAEMLFFLIFFKFSKLNSKP